MVPRLMIASVALWAVAGITAGVMRSVQDTAPAAAAAPVLSAIEKKADRLPLARQDSFADRMLVPPPEPTAISPHLSAPSAPSALRSVRIDRVCGDRGRRHFTRHHHRAWRCRR